MPKSGGPPGGPTRGSVRRQVLRDLPDLRLEDAWVLARTGNRRRYVGAVYLAGYAVECALKYRICLTRGAEYLPLEFEHHRLDALVREAGVTEPSWLLRLKWLISEWSVTMRYSVRSFERKDVDTFLQRAEEFVRWLKSH